MVKVRLSKPLIVKKDSVNGAMMTVQTILPWIDLLWAPVAALSMEKGKRFKTVGFVLACVMVLRFQVELLQQIGMNHGFFGVMESAILPRGQVTYGIFILLFLLLAYFSPGSDKHVHLAASITIMIAAFCVSTLVMVL